MPNYCVPCHSGEPGLTRTEAEERLKQLTGWAFSQEDRAITKRWAFKNYAEALAFVQKVSSLAEEEGHHPDIAFGWGYAEITFTTHATGSLHENDFVMAGLVDMLEGSNK